MITENLPIPPQDPSFELRSFILKWTPRVIAVCMGSYYGLGIAYEYGIMARIDLIAIPLIKHYFGYGGVGFLMPTFQWYAAWAVRITLGLIVGVFYDLLEKALKFLFEGVSNYFEHRAQRRDLVRAAF